MSPEIKAKWVAALRSGEYRQAHEVMVDTDGGMCCLAVLRHVVDPEDRSSRDEVGLSNDDAVNLAVRNDGSEGYHMHTFPEIADHIEAKL